MLTFFSKFVAPFTGFRASSVERSAVIFSVVILLGILAAVLLAVDGYLFYFSSMREDIPVASTKNSPLLTDRDIDTALQFLNDREEKMRAILGGEIVEE